MCGIRTKAHRGSWWLLLAALLATGCGDGRPTRVPAAGRVLIDGQPLTFGFIQVLPDGDRAASGQLGPDGRFSLTTYDPDDGVVPGKHLVAIIATESLNGSSQRWHAPPKYVDPETSGLEIEVTGPTDAIEINLTWDGGKPFVEKFDAE